MRLSEVTQRLTKLIYSNRSIGYYIAGAPGAGITHMLHQVGNALREQAQGAVVLGPLQANNPGEVCQLLISSLDNLGYLTETPPDGLGDLFTAWQWIGEHIALLPHAVLIILVDLGQVPPPGISKLAHLFSQARRIQSEPPCQARLCHLFAGGWDHPALEEHYATIDTSFPYTAGYNFSTWNGISAIDFQALIEKTYPAMSNIPLAAAALHEVVGGHPSAAEEVLRTINAEPFSLEGALKAINQIACEGIITARLIETWRQFPAETKQYLQFLLEQHKIQAPLALPPQLERLLLAGIVQKHPDGNRSYLGWRSWYVQLIVYHHAPDFGIQSHNIPLAELIPQASTISAEAYKVIHHLENLVRNHIIRVLWQQGFDGTDHPLVHRVWRENHHKGENDDAYERALDWRRRNYKQGVKSVLMNPSIAYLSTRDLCTLVQEASRQLESSVWQKVAELIDNLTGVRDAVMHNQLIDLPDLQRVYELQAAVYEALSA